MKFNKNLFITYSLVGASVVMGIGISTYAIIRINSENRSSQTTPQDWSNISEEFRNFSLENSLKISLQASNKFITSNGTNEAFLQTTGTAWSWYYERKNIYEYDWYLMTNFHVVNEPIAFNNGFTNIVNADDTNITYDADALSNYYKTNIKTTWNKSNSFKISKYNSNNQYSDLVTNVDSFVNSIEIITDFNNDNINLFSETDTYNKVKYNLDMSLIKISINFNENINTKYTLVNIYDNYINSYKNSAEAIQVSDSKKTYIAGNPSSSNPKLIGILLDPQKWNRKNMELTNSGQNKILSSLHAPYFFSENSYNNFGLTGGASGSAVYQVDNIYEDLKQLVPIGIYWGGRETNNAFFPSFIPFIDNLYNIYDNFSVFLKNF